MCVFFSKPKAAYELRISDWSSDVCSSDLRAGGGRGVVGQVVGSGLDGDAAALAALLDGGGQRLARRGVHGVDRGADDAAEIGGAADRVGLDEGRAGGVPGDRKSTRLNSSH